MPGTAVPHCGQLGNMGLDMVVPCPRSAPQVGRQYKRSNRFSKPKSIRSADLDVQAVVGQARHGWHR